MLKASYVYSDKFQIIFDTEGVVHRVGGRVEITSNLTYGLLGLVYRFNIVTVNMKSF